MSDRKHIFVGRKTELEKFQQSLGQTGAVQRLLFKPGHGVKPRVFLPYGIGGIGKSELSKRCLALARKAGWKTITIDWEKVEYRPVEPLQVMDAIAEKLQGEYTKSIVAPYISDRNRAGPTRDKVHRYRAEHPEEWQKLVEGVRSGGAMLPSTKAKVAAAAISTTLDVGPKVIAKAYDLLVDKMVERKVLKPDEASLYKNTDTQLAHHVVKAILKAADDHAVVILLDTCEILSLSLEEFLRDSVVCPAVEQGGPLIFIVSGRFSQYREREVEDADGNRRRVKGYADRLTDPQPIVWDLSLFVDLEVAEYLGGWGLDPAPELVAFVQRLARGVPFAVQLIADALLKIGVERVRKEFPPKDPAEFSPQEMVTLVVRRFLRYCLDDPVDETRLRALAVLRRRDDDALRAVWQLTPAERPRQLLTDLEARYGFVQPGEGALHEVVREFLRDSLRVDDRETARIIGQLACTHYRPLWEHETNTLSTIAERLAEQRWRTLTLDTLNALCWSDETAAIHFLAGRALEALEFDPGFAKGLVKLAREFRGSAEWWSSRSSRHFDGIARIVEGKGREGMAGLDELLRDAAELGLDNSQRCILQMWRAGNLADQGKPGEALKVCREAEQIASADESLLHALARRYGEVGNDLGFKQGAAVVSPEGKLAYERAVALDTTQAAYHNGLGAMLAVSKRADQLQLSLPIFTRAIELNPSYATAYNNRGNTHKALKDYAAALADYGRAIELNPTYATAFYNRGNTHAELKDYAAALADYGRAIELNPTYATAFYNRGNTHAELKDYAAALADYGRAIELNPSYATAYNNRGLTHHELKDYAAALADYGRAIELNPTDVTAYNNRGLTHHELKDYAAALADCGRAIELNPTDATPVYNTACAYALQSDLEQACEWLHRAICMDAKYVEMARTDSDFDSIRNTEEFQALLKS